MGRSLKESSGAKWKQGTHAYRVRFGACLLTGKTCRARMGKKRGGEAVTRSPCRLSPYTVSCVPVPHSTPLYRLSAIELRLHSLRLAHLRETYYRLI